MKPSLRPVIVEREKRKDGTWQVKIAVCHNHKIRYIGTGVYVSEWNPKQVPAEVLTFMGEVAAKLPKEDTDIRSLVKVLRGSTNSYYLLSVMEARIRRFKAVGNLNYALLIQSAINKIQALGLPTEVKSITRSWLDSFVDGCRKQGLSDNTIGIRLRDIRAAWYEADADSKNPWHKYRIPRKETRKRNLTAEQVKELISMDLTGNKAYARDMFILSIYLIGIEFVDLARLTHYDQGRVFYVRSKTKKPFSVKVYPEAAAIIAKHRGVKGVINILDRYCDYRWGLHEVNNCLKLIHPSLTTKWAKHTWSTIAYSIGIQYDIRRQALGHGIKVTDIYTEEDQTKVDRANKRVVKTIQPCAAGYQVHS